MAYCMTADLFNLVAEQKVREWADPMGDLNETAEDAVITAAITNGAAVMDSYISMGGNSVPVTDPPDFLRVVNAHMALCGLMHRMGVTAEEADQSILKQCDKFTEVLEKIAQGELPLAVKGDSAVTLKTVELARV